MRKSRKSKADARHVNKQSTNRIYECFFDASYRDGLSKCAFYVERDGIVIHKSVTGVQTRTCNLAEAEALFCLLKYVKKKIPQNNEVRIYGDSMVVVKLINGKRHIHKCYRSDYNKLLDLYNALKSRYIISVKHIRRDKNLLADKLSKSLDISGGMPCIEIKPMNLNSIIVPMYMRKTEPSAAKMSERLAYYRANGSLYREISVDENYVLLDGYISYLILLSHDIQTHSVYIVSGK